MKTGKMELINVIHHSYNGSREATNNKNKFKET